MTKSTSNRPTKQRRLSETAIRAVLLVNLTAVGCFGDRDGAAKPAGGPETMLADDVTDTGRHQSEQQTHIGESEYRQSQFSAFLGQVRDSRASQYAASTEPSIGPENSSDPPLIQTNPWVSPKHERTDRQFAASAMANRDATDGEFGIQRSMRTAAARMQLTAPELSDADDLLLDPGPSSKSVLDRENDGEDTDAPNGIASPSDRPRPSGRNAGSDRSKRNPIEDFADFRREFAERDRGPAWNLAFGEAVQLGLVNNKEVAVIEALPEVDRARVGIERGEFDPVVGVNTFGGEDDRQVRSEIATFGAAVDNQSIDYFRPFSGLNQAFVRQELATGGSYEVGFGTNYLRFVPDAPELIVPSGWESAINLQYTQPLLRGRGRAAAQRDLRIAAARAKQTEFEFRSQLRKIVRDVDLAYWELAFQERRLVSAEAFVAIAKIFLEQELERQELGQSARPDILQVQSVLNEFVVELTKNERNRNVAEMRLRTELGIAELFMQSSTNVSMTDEKIFGMIRPSTAELMPVNTDQMSSQLAADVARAMTRPELVEQDAKIEEARANYAAARNQLLPDVNAQVLYSKVGLEKNLGDSIGTIFDQGFDTYGVGVTFQQRVGLRSEQAEVRQYYFQIASETARRAEIAHDVVGELRELLAEIEGSIRLLKNAEDFVDVLIDQQKALDELYKDGKVTLFQRLGNIRSLQLAELDMQDRWGELAQALALYRFERGDDATDHGVRIENCATCL